MTLMLVFGAIAIALARCRVQRLTNGVMAEKIALLFAGQGAQIVGMGKDLAEQFPAAADLFRQADEILGRKLSDIAWSGPIEEFRP